MKARQSLQDSGAKVKPKQDEKQTEIMRRMERRIDSLEKNNRIIGREMVDRGKEITKMIRIFLMVEHILPEGPREEFRNVAVGYAVRCDQGNRSRYCRGNIDFQEKTGG
jgi:hypothetical protein